MSRKIAIGLVSLILFATPCLGQDWARKMFKITEHDFGSVAAGGQGGVRIRRREYLHGRGPHCPRSIPVAVALPPGLIMLR